MAAYTGDDLMNLAQLIEWANLHGVPLEAEIRTTDLLDLYAVSYDREMNTIVMSEIK